MELDRKKVFKLEVKTLPEVAEERGVTVQALIYAKNNNQFDFIKMGRDILIVYTRKTIEYLSKPRRAESASKRVRLSL